MRLFTLIFAFGINLILLARGAFWTLATVVWRTFFRDWQAAARERTPERERKATRKQKATIEQRAGGGQDRQRHYLMMLSFIEWDGSWQRPQHLASHLSRRMDVVCCAPVRAHNLSLPRALQLLFSSREQVSDGLTVLRPLLLPAENRFGWVRRLNALLLFDALQREIVRRGAIPSVLLTNSPFFALPFTWLPARLRVYDVMDELVRFPSAPPDAAELERLVAAQCDLVTTGTKSLWRLKSDQYGASDRRVRYVAGGVDVAHFAPPPPGTPLPADIARLPRPIVGFFGAINERIDPDVLAALADGFPNASIVLIGPVYQSFAGLKNRPNVHFLGLKPYGELPRYLAAFDCAIIPYRMSDGIEFVQPVKALEYLAGGKPVVSTRIPDLVELYSDRVRLAADPKDFARLVREAIAENEARSGKEAPPPDARTWEEMAEEFAQLFEAAACRRHGAAERRGDAAPRPSDTASTRGDAATGPCDAARRVAHLLHGLHLGGGEQAVINLCVHYDPAQFVGLVVCLGYGRLLQERLRERGVPARVVEMRGKWDLGVVFRLIRLLRAEKIDLIHTHTGRTNLIGRLVSRVTGLPVVTTVQSAVARDINDLGRSNRINAWVERLTQNLSARLVSVSEHNLRELLRGGADPAKALHIPNGVELPREPQTSPQTSLSVTSLCAVPTVVASTTATQPNAATPPAAAPDELPRRGAADGAPQVPSHEELDRLRRELGLPGEEGFVVGMLASMRPRKGPDVLLRAMPLVIRQAPKARLLMVGSGEFVERMDYLEILKNLARELGVQDRVVFTGHRDDTTAMLSLMDVVVLPSLFGEGMPLVLLEAMALGKPTIATRTEGNDEVVRDGETGLLVPPSNAGALADAIVLLLRDPAVRRMMGGAARTLVEARFSIARVTRQYETVYRDVLNAADRVYH